MYIRRSTMPNLNLNVYKYIGASGKETRLLQHSLRPWAAKGGAACKSNNKHPTARPFVRH